MIEALRSRLKARRPAAMAIAFLALVLSCAPTLAQDVDGLLKRQDETAAEQARIAETISLGEARMRELATEIGAIRKDHASLTAAMIQAAKTEKKLAQDIEDIGARLERLRARQETLRLSLADRRDVLAQVLGALQRMGLNPPPALLVRPEDALGSVRSAILLGAVVPELRGETLVLVADLRELSAVAQSIEGERERLFATVREQVAERERLVLLQKEKQALLAERQDLLSIERRRAAELAERSSNLKELIAALGKEIDGARRAAEEARRLEEERLRREAEAANRPVPEGNRLQASIPFESLKRQVELPVSGAFVRRFGAEDGLGSHTQGDTVGTQSGSIVTSPADANVLYAGPFRSYGQLLILDAGDGYHIVLSGLGRIGVSPGQSVLTGEPVGSMGEARLASTAAFGNAKANPELYIEFRKDGKPVDPAPWWTERVSGRTGNGT